MVAFKSCFLLLVDDVHGLMGAVTVTEKLFLLLLLQRLEEDHKAQILWIIYVKCVYSNVTF